MLLDILYKRTNTGAVQTWRQEINDAGDSYRTISGQLDGKLVTSEWTVCKPKNVGRANETTAQQQCASEVESNYTKKLNQGGYSRTVDVIDNSDNGYFKPMLAKSFDDYRDSVNFFNGTWYSQGKLDGIRAVVKKDGMWTRQGKPIPTCPHIIEALQPLFAQFGEDAVFDGEIYTDRLADNFNELVSIAKKAKPTAADLQKSRETLQYHMYDFPAFPDNTFEERYRILKNAVDKLDTDVLVCVETTLVSSQEHMDSLYAAYMEAGLEGQMLRNGKSKYQNKRTKDLLKRKEFLDSEFKVLDILEGEGNRSGMAGAVVCLLPDGKTTFKATPKGTNAHRIDMLKRKAALIGKDATVRYFTPTPAGIPRFPVLVAIHETDRW